jgi:hypothetical protein
MLPSVLLDELVLRQSDMPQPRLISGQDLLLLLLKHVLKGWLLLALLPFGVPLLLCHRTQMGEM